MIESLLITVCNRKYVWLRVCWLQYVTESMYDWEFVVTVCNRKYVWLRVCWLQYVTESMYGWEFVDYSM